MVEMTTGATIHTTEGLKMTVTRQNKHPIFPNLETKNLIQRAIHKSGFDQSQADQQASEDDQTSEIASKF
jgi:protein required for attachment to host cells